MNILVQLSHPAHFHLYKNIINNLKARGHKVFVLIKTKDILEDLLQKEGIAYCNILPVPHRKNKLGILWDMLVRDVRIASFVWRHDIDLLTGSTPEVAHVGWLMRKHAINTGEDDASVIPLIIKMIKPFMETCLCPIACNRGAIEHKSIKYSGYQKLAYLHPNHFTPKREIVESYGIDTSKPYFLLRFAELKAHHDDGIAGINTEIAQHLLDILLPHGQVYITSERKLESQFEQYRLRINPLDVHHVMYYATLYLGDSQSMAVEAAILGVPSIRFNDFAGRIGILEELEHTYKLTIGIKSSNPQKLYNTINELLSIPNLKLEWQARRKQMLSDKIDVTAFFTWFIENYPESKQIMRDNPNYQYQFR